MLHLGERPYIAASCSIELPAVFDCGLQHVMREALAKIGVNPVTYGPNIISWHGWSCLEYWKSCGYTIWIQHQHLYQPVFLQEWLIQLSPPHFGYLSDGLQFTCKDIAHNWGFISLWYAPQVYRVSLWLYVPKSACNTCMMDFLVLESRCLETLSTTDIWCGIRNQVIFRASFFGTSTYNCDPWLGGWSI